MFAALLRSSPSSSFLASRLAARRSFLRSCATSAAPSASSSLGATFTNVTVLPGPTQTLLLPLQGEMVAFPLYTDKTVRDLVLDIRDEDHHAKEVRVTDFSENSNRMSHSTTLADLLQAPFKIKVDDAVYTVDASEIMGGSGALGAVLGQPEIRDLVLKLHFTRIRTKLLNDKRHHMPYSEYLQWCYDEGLDEQQARKLSKALHLTGVILHFHENDALRGVIFHNPETVEASVAEVLNMKGITLTTDVIRKKLDEILPVYLILHRRKLDLDKRAAANAKGKMVAIGAYLSFQTAIMMRMVWWEFNWDIMEPISYFVGMMTPLVGLLFFSLYRQEYTYFSLQERQRLSSLRKLYISEEFNWEKWNMLDKKVREYKESLGEANCPPELLEVLKEEE